MKINNFVPFLILISLVISSCDLSESNHSQPTVLKTIPAKGERRAPMVSDIVIEFDQDMNSETFEKNLFFIRDHKR